MSWHQTHSGRKFDLLNPNPDDVYIYDIAISLSKLCRFNGHCRDFYSVAEHSVNVSRQVPDELAIQALMHDAAEAYIGDIILPLDKLLKPVLGPIKLRVEEAIAKRYSYDWPKHPLTHKADMRMLITERNQLLKKTEHWEFWEIKEEPYDIKIDGFMPPKAEEIFLDRFFELRPEEHWLYKKLHGDRKQWQ